MQKHIAEKKAHTQTIAKLKEHIKSVSELLAQTVEKNNKLNLEIQDMKDEIQM